MGVTPVSPRAPWASQFILDFQPLSRQAGGEPTLSHSVDPPQQQGQQRSWGWPRRWLVISGHPLSRSCGPFSSPPCPPQPSPQPLEAEKSGENEKQKLPSRGGHPPRRTASISSPNLHYLQSGGASEACHRSLPVPAPFSSTPGPLEEPLLGTWTLGKQKQISRPSAPRAAP